MDTQSTEGRQYTGNYHQDGTRPKVQIVSAEAQAGKDVCAKKKHTLTEEETEEECIMEVEDIVDDKEVMEDATLPENSLPPVSPQQLKVTG
jgi:hypothetical protein